MKSLDEVMHANKTLCEDGFGVPGIEDSRLQYEALFDSRVRLRRAENYIKTLAVLMHQNLKFNKTVNDETGIDSADLTLLAYEKVGRYFSYGELVAAALMAGCPVLNGRFGVNKKSARDFLSGEYLATTGR